MQQDLTIQLVEFGPAVQAIRVAVFQQEQGIAAALEFDGCDTTAQHLLANWRGITVGTTRIRRLHGTTAKLERVAVLPGYRSRGIGRAMMQFAIDDLTTEGIGQIQLHAQLAVVPFYQSLGFIAASTIFESAGIPHIAMQRDL